MLATFEDVFETHGPKIRPLRLRHGDSVTLKSKIKNSGVSADMTGYEAKAYYQPASACGLDEWYEISGCSIEGDTASVDWNGSLDNGSPGYRLMLRIEKESDVFYTSVYDISLLPSPGFEPHALDPIPKIIDFSTVSAVNAPWTTSAEVIDLIHEYGADGEYLPVSGGYLSGDFWLASDPFVAGECPRVRIGTDGNVVAEGGKVMVRPKPGYTGGATEVQNGSIYQSDATFGSTEYAPSGIAWNGNQYGFSIDAWNNKITRRDLSDVYEYDLPNESGTIATLNDLSGFLTTETDPVFTEWKNASGVSLGDNLSDENYFAVFGKRIFENGDLVLPTAGANTLGAVKVNGNNLAILEDGTLSASEGGVKGDFLPLSGSTLERGSVSGEIIVRDTTPVFGDYVSINRDSVTFTIPNNQGGERKVRYTTMGQVVFQEKETSASPVMTSVQTFQNKNGQVADTDDIVTYAAGDGIGIENDTISVKAGDGLKIDEGGNVALENEYLPVSGGNIAGKLNVENGLSVGPASGSFANDTQGAYSIALGRANISYGDDSFAQGYYTRASSRGCVAIGNQATASGQYTFAWQGMQNAGRYTSNGEGTFNVNPASGVSGFYIGSQNLPDIVNGMIDEKLGPIEAELASI